MADIKKTEAENDFENIKDMLKKYWKNIAINIFEWKRKNGEPVGTIANGLTSEIIEDWLYGKGKALWVKDEKVGYLCLKAHPVDKQNVYFKPTKYRAIGNNYNVEYDVDKCVLIKNNSLQEPTEEMIDFYCGKLAEIEMTKELRRDAHKTPFELETTEDTLLSAKNVYKKIRASEPVIYKNKSRGENEVGVKVLDTDVQWLNDKLDDEYNNYVAKILTALGLDNYVEDKAERVQSAEVEAQQEYINASFRASLECRKKACEEINNMFGLDLVVDYIKGEQVESDEPVDETEEEEINE